MFLKKLIKPALCGMCLFSTVNADDVSELKEMLLKQQQKIEALENKVEKQQSVHNEALSHYIKNEVDRALKTRSTNLLTLGSNVENLTIKGDFRTRFQRNEFDPGQSSRDRFRLRFRLGFVWKTDEGWEIGAGFATGSNGSGSGRSTNATLNAGGTPFETNALNLDYAYAKHTWKHDGRTSTITLGQFKNPFVTTGAFWDSDLRPTGVAYHYTTTNRNTNYFLTAGAFTVAHLSEGRGNNDVTMYSLQAGVKNDDFIIALAFHNLSDEFVEVQNNVSTNANSGNEYQIIDFYAKYMFNVAEIDWSVYGQIAYNLGAKDRGSHIDTPATPVSSGENLSWVIGADAKWDKLKLVYEFRHMEANGQPAAFTDSTFGSASNHAGHAFKAKYTVTKSMTVGLNYYILEEIQTSSASTDQEQIMQAEVIYKF